LTILMTAQSSFKALDVFGPGTEIIAGAVFDKAGNCTAQPALAGRPEGGPSSNSRPTRTGVGTKVLHNFRGAADGEVPLPSLIIDGAGNLYGTAREDGAIGDGVVFSYGPQHRRELDRKYIA
jgi:hypothetical protein